MPAKRALEEPALAGVAGNSGNRHTKRCRQLTQRATEDDELSSGTVT